MEGLEATAEQLHKLADTVIAQSAGLNKNIVIKDKVDQIVAFYNDKIQSYMQLLDSDKEVIDELHNKIRTLEEQAESGTSKGNNVNELLQQEKRNRLQTEEQSISITTQQEETINRLESKLKQQEDIIQQYQQKLKEAGIPFHCQPSVKHLAPTPRARSGTLPGSVDGSRLDSSLISRNSSTRESSLLSQTAPTTPLLSSMDRTFGSTQTGFGTPRAGTPRTGSWQEAGLPTSTFQNSNNFTPAGGYRSTSGDNSNNNCDTSGKVQVNNSGSGVSMSASSTLSRPDKTDINLMSSGNQPFDSSTLSHSLYGQQSNGSSSLPQSRGASVESNARSLGLGGVGGTTNYFNTSTKGLQLPQSRSGSGSADGLHNHSAVPFISKSTPSLSVADSLSSRTQLGQTTPRNQAMQAQILADPVSSFMKEIQQLRVNSAMNTPRAEALPSATTGMQSATSVGIQQRAATPRGMVNFNSVVPQSQQTSAAPSNLDAVSSFLEDVKTSLDTLNEANRPAHISATAKFKSLIEDTDIRGIAAQAAPTRNSFDSLGGSARDFAIRRN
eukprot:TRINITY_DN16204_c0_g3_i1.p1 TRINITY_DN16204_c0_g3~~TRINITY_DN16204_c0_g3_i1.p1  ORF type:complete len:555 (+),score=125.66 TRINITY_DN16204_c0_g3_i1:87-1751(+)